MTKCSTLSAILVLLLALFASNPHTTFGANDEPRSPKPEQNRPRIVEPYEAVTAFCNHRKKKADRDFCYKVLISDPRSNSAKDNVGLLIISVDSALHNANKTKAFLTALSRSKGASKMLIAVLKECGSAYDWCIGELKIIPKELEGDPLLASYDALMASDALDSCRKSLNASKINDRLILSRHKLATAYVQLCVDIANTVG